MLVQAQWQVSAAAAAAAGSSGSSALAAAKAAAAAAVPNGGGMPRRGGLSHVQALHYVSRYSRRKTKAGSAGPTTGERETATEGHARTFIDLPDAGSDVEKHRDSQSGLRSPLGLCSGCCCPSAACKHGSQREEMRKRCYGTSAALKARCCARRSACCRRRLHLAACAQPWQALIAHTLGRNTSTCVILLFNKRPVSLQQWRPSALGAGSLRV